MKYLYVFMGMLGLWTALTSCRTTSSEEPLISVTIEPQRYFVEQIAGETFQVNCLTPSGQSPETYDPTPQQLMDVGRSVAYFRIGYIGFEQAWMPRLEEQNPQMQVFDLSAGMELIEDPETHEAEGHHHGAIDPHVWTSFGGARVIAANVRDALAALAPEHQALYQQRYDSLMVDIAQTETEVRQMLAPLRGTAFIIYHPALTYFAHEFGLTQLCIELDGKEPSPAQLATLIETAREQQVRVVFIQQEFDQKNAELIAEETGCRLVRINPLAYDWKEGMVQLAKALAGNE